MGIRLRRALPWLLPLVAIAACALYLRHFYNWGPPEVLAQALASPPIGREALTTTLNAQYLVGTDEAALKSTLLAQGFTHTPQARTSCIKPEASGMAYGPCPAGTQQMAYDYRFFGDLVCDIHTLMIVWSADRNGKVASVKATHYVACL
jgi:hypothetical protein